VSGTQLDEWVRLVALLPALVDERWLEANVQKVAEGAATPRRTGSTRAPEHPLAELTFQVRAELELWGDPEFRPTANLARLGALAFSIRVLREARVSGLNERVSRLTTSNADDFESARFELDVAALFVVSGRTVRFVEELPDERTPDLEVDGVLEVECKRKVELSQRDLAMRNSWEFLERQPYKTLPERGAFRVEFSTRAAPTRTDIDWRWPR
jgi:hypothetical protein